MVPALPKINFANRECGTRCRRCKSKSQKSEERRGCENLPQDLSTTDCGQNRKRNAEDGVERLYKGRVAPSFPCVFVPQQGPHYDSTSDGLPRSLEGQYPSMHVVQNFNHHIPPATPYWPTRAVLRGSWGKRRGFLKLSSPMCSRRTRGPSPTRFGMAI